MTCMHVQLQDIALFCPVYNRGRPICVFQGRYRLLQIKYTDNRYFEPIYVSGVKMKMNAKINNNKSSDKKKRSLNAFKHVFNSENC